MRVYTGYFQEVHNQKSANLQKTVIYILFGKLLCFSHASTLNSFSHINPISGKLEDVFLSFCSSCLTTKISTINILANYTFMYWLGIMSSMTADHFFTCFCIIRSLSQNIYWVNYKNKLADLFKLQNSHV